MCVPQYKYYTVFHCPEYYINLRGTRILGASIHRSLFFCSRLEIKSKENICNDVQIQVEIKKNTVVYIMN